MTQPQAHLFNLIIYTQKNKRTDYIRKIADQITHKFPSRILFISVESQAQSDFIEITKQELQTDGINCNLLEIKSSEKNQERIPFIILPHLVTDLPVYVLWTEDPAQDNPLSYTLENLASRLICDSESTSNLPQFAKLLLQHLEKSKCAIADLNWARMEKIREVLSMTFHSTDRLEQLKNTQSIHICYNALASEFFSHPNIQAIYLQTWLSQQMQWERKEIKKEKDKLLFVYNNQGKELNITLEGVQKEGLSPGSIVSLDITTSGQEHFAFKRDPKVPNQIILENSSADKCGLPYTFIFPKGEAGASLVKEIFHRGTSAHFLKVLQNITTMDSSLLC